ncbi:MAG: hypothetical protein DLM61_20370 [Pseudonocardiales bacterium]|nr:MAG: hypothetical protein DLM61_20370 [Pseudonocardiales bacterium]
MVQPELLCSAPPIREAGVKIQSRIFAVEKLIAFQGKNSMPRGTRAKRDRPEELGLDHAFE